MKKITLNKKSFLTDIEKRRLILYLEKDLNKSKYRSKPKPITDR